MVVAVLFVEGMAIVMLSVKDTVIVICLQAGPPLGCTDPARSYSLW